MPLNSCNLDPAPLFDLYRGRLSTEILCAVACRTQFFQVLGNTGSPFAETSMAMNWSDHHECRSHCSAGHGACRKGIGRSLPADRFRAVVP